MTTIPAVLVQPGDILHINASSRSNLRRRVTSAYVLDTNTVMIHLDGLGGHPFASSEQVEITEGVRTYAPRERRISGVNSEGLCTTCGYIKDSYAYGCGEPCV